MLLSGMDNDLLQVVHYFLPALVVGVMAKVSFGAMRSVASMLDRNHRYPLPPTTAPEFDGDRGC